MYMYILSCYSAYMYIYIYMYCLLIASELLTDCLKTAYAHDMIQASPRAAHGIHGPGTRAKGAAAQERARGSHVS